MEDNVVADDACIGGYVTRRVACTNNDAATPIFKYKVVGDCDCSCGMPQVDAPPLVTKAYVVPYPPAQIRMVDAMNSIACPRDIPDVVDDVPNDLRVVRGVAAIVNTGTSIAGTSRCRDVVYVIADYARVGGQVENAR